VATLALFPMRLGGNPVTRLIRKRERKNEGRGLVEALMVTKGRKSLVELQSDLGENVTQKLGPGTS